MSRYFSYLNSAKEILSLYSGDEPFASFIKKYFAKYKKFGSKDRKQISHLCYCYFRLGTALNNIPAEERILIGLFLCSPQSNEVLKELRPEWNEKAQVSVEEKLSMFNVQRSTLNLFPFQDELTEGIDIGQFILSHLEQPDLFLRLRPGKELIVKQKLEKAGIGFSQLANACIALPNSSGVDSVIELNMEAVVQDYSSQKTGELLANLKAQTENHKLEVWDCCAASGGKSMMLYDLDPTIGLTVSDVREPILTNLRKRFKEAGIKKYQSFVIDLTKPVNSLKLQTFNLIICDAPCSGSGTWGRTPEQLVYFKKDKIDKYALLQRQIISNTISQLKPGGYFLYITCSVFKKENEEIAESIRKGFNFHLIKMELLKGYDKKADTMFAALLQKPL
ncbi:MAG: Fmu (Sun) domain-containing protein [Chitinophagaceae bacterium]